MRFNHNHNPMPQSDPSQIKALSQSPQTNTPSQSLQKSLNPSLLLAPVFQFGFRNIISKTESQKNPSPPATQLL
jgi:hypothetical protein